MTTSFYLLDLAHFLTSVEQSKAKENQEVQPKFCQFWPHLMELPSVCKQCFNVKKHLMSASNESSKSDDTTFVEDFPSAASPDGLRNFPSTEMESTSTFEDTI